jgi:hypothetical protein
MASDGCITSTAKCYCYLTVRMHSTIHSVQKVRYSQTNSITFCLNCFGRIRVAVVQLYGNYPTIAIVCNCTNCCSQMKKQILHKTLDIEKSPLSRHLRRILRRNHKISEAEGRSRGSSPKFQRPAFSAVRENAFSPK